MQPKVTLLTLGVSDLERSVAFYRDGLGWPTRGIVGRELRNGAVAFFDLQAGMKLALWPRTSIAAETGLSAAGRCLVEFMLAHNVDSVEEVDEVMCDAARAGATRLKPAQKTAYGGYAGCFQDPDGHVWEVAYNPDFDSL